MQNQILTILSFIIFTVGFANLWVNIVKYQALLMLTKGFNKLHYTWWIGWWASILMMSGAAAYIYLS